MSDGPDPLGRLFGRTTNDDDGDTSDTTPGGEDTSGETEYDRGTVGFGGARGRGSTRDPGEIAAMLPDNLQNWVERMVDQSDDITHRDVLLSDAFEKFADGYGYDVDWIHDHLTE